MTKAKARARAKARAAAKIARPAATDDKPEVKAKRTQLDMKSNVMRDRGGAANIKSAAGMRRGAARSR